MTVMPRPPLVARLTPPQSVAVDGFLAAAYGAVAWRVLVPDVSSTWVVAGTVGLVVTSLVLGRPHPLAALVVALGALCLSPIASAVAFVALFPVSYALYSVTTRSRAGVGLVAIAGCVAGSVTTALPGFEHRGAVIPFALVFITTWTIGYAVRQQRSYIARLAEHHRELAEAEIAEAKRSAAESRLVMARELHDVVAHNMSVITVQAGYGNLVIEQQPDRARAALDVIEQTGRKTLTEMRTLMGVLRRDDETPADAPLTPAPGLADIDALIADTARAGVTVDLVVRGTRRVLPAGVDLSAYRIVQEALTNVIKHAGVAEARAVIEFGADELTIDITDEGTGFTRAGASAPGGHGLVGMEERVKAYGGRLCAEPVAGKGYRVLARLPLREASA